MSTFRKYMYLCMMIGLISLTGLQIVDAKDTKEVEKAQNGSGKLVYVIPIEKEVERGLEAFLKRTTEEAEEAFADHIIFEIDTPGGRVDSAKQIAKILQNLNIPTTAYITNDALSAGSYIALNTDEIYMSPQATMGASGVIDEKGNAADKKAQSAWIAAMRSAAESKDRDPKYATAMADPSMDLPEYGAPKGEYLTLDAKSALKVKYSEGIIKHRTELLEELNLQNAEIVESETTIAEEVARFLTNPIVVPILLSIASLGFIVELYSPGFGIPGSMALVSLILFFYAHIVAGLAGMEAILLLILGIILIVIEFFIPGGIVGAFGVASIVGSLFMSGYSLANMALSVSIAIVVAAIVGFIMYKYVGLNKGLFKHIVLSDRTMTEQGYISSDDKSSLLGQVGKTLTALRPAGTAVFDQDRVDVVSEGRFVEKDCLIKVVQVEGVRVVVREVTDQEEE